MTPQYPPLTSLSGPETCFLMPVSYLQILIINWMNATQLTLLSWKFWGSKMKSNFANFLLQVFPKLYCLWPKMKILIMLSKTFLDLIPHISQVYFHHVPLLAFSISTTLNYQFHILLTFLTFSFFSLTIPYLMSTLPNQDNSGLRKSECGDLPGI